MKLNRLPCLLFLFCICSAAIRLQAQQNESNQSRFEAIKAKTDAANARIEDNKRWALQGDPAAQYNLGIIYLNGDGVPADRTEAAKWFRKASEQGVVAAQSKLAAMQEQDANAAKNVAARGEAKPAIDETRKKANEGDAKAQCQLGNIYCDGDGVTKDMAEATKWWRKAADQGEGHAQYFLGACYFYGEGVAVDKVEAVQWYRKSAEGGYADAQFNLGICFLSGDGVPKDYVQAHAWLNLASAQGFRAAKQQIAFIEGRMSIEQIAEAQQRASRFRTKKMIGGELSNSEPVVSGSGFLISEDGFLISNAHVVEGAAQVRLVTSAGLISAKVVKVDAAHDLALLKAEGRFAPLPISPSRAAKLGSTVATVGFPNIGLQGFAPKLAKGEIAGLSGAADDARYFQISVPVQPGNSGGALVDERGNVVGVVSAKLNASAALQSSGALPENVNYAVKSSYLLSFLESVPDVASKLKEASAKEKKFEDVVKEAEQAAVLVLVY